MATEVALQAAVDMASIASHSLATSLMIHRDLWLRSPGFSREVQNTIKDLPFDETNLFSEQTEESLHSQRFHAMIPGHMHFSPQTQAQTLSFLLWSHMTYQANYISTTGVPAKAPAVLETLIPSFCCCHLHNLLPTTGPGLILMCRSRTTNLLGCQVLCHMSSLVAILPYLPVIRARSPPNRLQGILPKNRFFNKKQMLRSSRMH